MKSLIRFLLLKRGLRLVKTKSINLRDVIVDHPLNVLNEIQNKGNSVFVLLNIPISKCRTQIWNTLEIDKNPFVKTIVSHNKTKSLDYESSEISNYYNNYQPNGASDVLRIPNNNGLKNIPAIGYVLPWENFTYKELINKRERIALSENKKAGKTIGLSSGYTDFGPVSEEKGELEFKRLIEVYENIKNKGYKEKLHHPDGGISGYFLIGEDNKWCFFIKSGKHRSYALSALGYTHIPVSLELSLETIKHISTIEFWPQVKNELFTELEARLLVKNILNL